ncbi:hypothetical protein Poli38472_003324 [Pythium oligandrum]|uniref:TATA-binding protein interacting (TIP20) domain-containing protein n=1 Tax=Pythium oligandrum TaxID=41045 RepID=A0A8K1C6B2_PYTOL|nr:hypothetical protein Poli38472_003324 [Pythium oligandrum]|eukprot:TMW57399.1 hypothetical protein Poli38472_003324 [Pythium oligandrum]
MPAMDERIALLLDKTTDYDKDERYMATSDLCNELNNNVELGSYLESKVCSAVLKQLDDKSNDVQSIAVKCLGILVTKVQEAQVADICTKLSELLLNGKAELRDIYAIGLKTILADVSHKTGTAIATNLCVRLLGGLRADAVTAVKSETLDIFTDLLRRFGHAFTTEHENIMNLLIVQLTDESPLVRKRATACVGSLGVMTSDVLLTRLIDHLINGIKSTSDSADTRTLIQTVGTLSRSAGHRLGAHLDAILPILAGFCGDPDDEEMQSESSDELRENCFQAFESFVLRCHNGITPHIDRVLTLALAFLKYDPNYNYGDTEDEDEEMEEDEEEYSDIDEGDYSDDDDTSWKVRRAALRVLSALIATRPELLEHFYKTASPLLISRFKEREENVRIDVLTVFSELLGATRKALPPAGQPQSAAITTCINTLQERTRGIVLAANKQFGHKASVSSRIAVLSLLTELTLVLRGQLAEFVDVLMPNLLRAAEDKHSDLKLETMVYLRLLIDAHEAQAFSKHVSSLVKVALNAARGDWYKTVAKALGLIESLVRIVRIDVGSAESHVVPLFEAVLASLKANDIDQEIKESALSCVAQLIAQLGNFLGDRVQEVYPVLLDRLGNDITRVQSMKAIATIARSDLTLDLSPILSDATISLAQLLRQQSRTLKQATLDALNGVVTHMGQELSVDLLATVLTEASVLLADNDLQLCRLSITLVSNIVKANPSVATTEALQQKVLPQTIELSQSVMLQGATLDVLKALFAQLTELNAPGSDFEPLFAALTQPVAESSKQAFVNRARCVAAVCSAASPERRQTAFSSFVSEVSSSTAETNHVLALYCLGEFGRVISLQGYPDVKPAILDNFGASVEIVKNAAAYALGSICVGNMAEYIESIVQKLEQGENSYLLLASLREVISYHATIADDDFSRYVDRVLPVLQQLSEREEEGVRNLVAECIGKLSVTDHAKLAPVITSLSSASSERSRWTGVTSLKYAVTTTAKREAVEPLFENITPVVKALEDDDLNVRRAALLALNTTAHHHASFLVPYVKEQIFPVLLKTTEVKLERVVDLGPFKHKVDDGLPIRKAAYSFADTLLEVLPQELDVAAFFPYLQVGLKDQDDVQMLCHQILAKICRLQPGAIVSALDYVLEPLEKTVNKKVKEDQVGTEVERAKDLIRSGLRAVDALSAVRDTETHPKFHTFYENIKKNPTLWAQLEAIKTERLSG